MTNKRVRDLINESGAGLWGTDKARERLQKDTPGQEIKSLVKKSQKVSEAADPKGTIKVVKQDKVRYITKDELNTYRQMGWKQAEKRPQGDDKIRAAKKAHAAGTWDGNVNKDGKPIVHIDGKPVVVEGYDRAAISAALRKAAEKENMKSKRDVERFFDYSGGDIIFRMVKDEDEANVLIGQFKSQYKQKFNEDAEPLNELKVSFKFDKLADAAKAERKAMQMKKLDVDSEKIQGKNMWLLHVTGNYTDIMKYLKRHDLEDKVHESAGIDEGMLDTLKQRVQQAQDALKKFRDSETAKKVRDDHRARVEKGKKVLDAPNLRKKINKESIEEGSETWEDGYKRRVVKTTKPEHKEKGYNWRIKGKDKDHLTIKLYKEKPSQAEFNKQMKRVAGHEFGG